MIETKSHRAALDTLLTIGKMFFSGERHLARVKLRLFPLLIGPTGVGKSFAVEEAARVLRAEYFKVTRGDWLVTGSKTGRPTVFQILDRVAVYDRVVLHLDELDKFRDLQSSDWSAAIASDLWNMLDGKFQLTEYLRDTNFDLAGKKMTERELAERVRNLWIVGSGTWQSVFARGRAGMVMGFDRDRKPERIAFETVARAEMISPELLHRFGEPILLEYPSKEETAELLESTGIARVSSRLGVPVTPEQIDWTQGGMRVLETIATRLAITCYRREHEALFRMMWGASGEPSKSLE